MTKNTTTIHQWRSPASEYPRRRSGVAKISTTWYAPGFYECYRTRGHDYYHAPRRLYITTLAIDGEVWMVDDPPHWWAMQAHAATFTGHVICAGLGLGLMVHALNNNPAVTRVTVIEREQDVIDLVGPLVPHDKLTIVHDDWFAVEPDSLPPADGVLFDLFVGNGHELIGAGIRAVYEILTRWENPELPVRVHGLANPWIADMARTMLAAQRPNKEDPCPRQQPAPSSRYASNT